MQFLLTITVFFYDTPVFYKISRVSLTDYYAEPTDKNMRSFKLKKSQGMWISEGGFTEWQGAQIGEKLDKLCFETVKD